MVTRHAPMTDKEIARPMRDLAKDPVCGMVIDKATALMSERGGRTYHFCSANCQRTFESPEAELKSMRTRVSVALTGVRVLAILRAAAFIALAAGATIVTWAPIPALPWFTRGEVALRNPLRRCSSSVAGAFIGVPGALYAHGR
jgi:Cu+-exporting ATPase